MATAGDDGVKWNVYINCYNAGSVYAPAAVESQNIAGFSWHALSHWYIDEDPTEFWSLSLYNGTPLINSFNYGAATMSDGMLAHVFTGYRYGRPMDYVASENVFYLDTSGKTIDYGYDEDSADWGEMWKEVTATLVTSLTAEQFKDGSLVAKLNDFRAKDGSYPGREGGVSTGRGKWVHGAGEYNGMVSDGSFPEL